MLQQMDVFLNETVRPYLQEHHGEVALISFEEGVLRLRLLGACTHCPSAAITVEEVIGSELKAAFPEVTEVRLVNDVSEDMLQMAKRILNHEGSL